MRQFYERLKKRLIIGMVIALVVLAWILNAEKA